MNYFIYTSHQREKSYKERQVFISSVKFRPRDVPSHVFTVRRSFDSCYGNIRVESMCWRESFYTGIAAAFGFLFTFIYQCNFSFWSHVYVISLKVVVTTVFVDTHLWNTKHQGKRYPKFPSVLRVIDRTDRNAPSLRHAIGLGLVDFDPICQ